MTNLFSELEQLGLNNLNKVQIYNTDDYEEDRRQKEIDILYDRTYNCPVCEKSFKTKAVKTGKVRLLGIDTDLRPNYATVDTIKYDAIVCSNCGYAALDRYFSNITNMQVKWVKENISSNFKGLKKDLQLFDYDEALKRYKLALINSIVKKSKPSEKAYICLKITWLIRGKRALINDKKIIDQLNKQEKEFVDEAYEGFVKSLQNEKFPICGMDEPTLTYLLGELARKCDDLDQSLKYLGRVITFRGANDRIKDKARELKYIVKEQSNSLCN